MWTCTSQYDEFYDQVKVCPFVEELCGSNQEINVLGLSVPSSIQINSGETKGNVCLYKVYDSNSLEQFSVNDTDNF